jgi:hypothetical protein
LALRSFLFNVSGLKLHVFEFAHQFLHFLALFALCGLKLALLGHTRFFEVFPSAAFGGNARFLTLLLETLQGVFNRLSVFYDDYGHKRHSPLAREIPV